jgi:hypothetical protein
VGGLFDRAVRAGIRHGWRRGLIGGSQAWLAVGAAALGVRVLQRLAAGKPVIVTERLDPGESIIVRHLLPGE